MRAHPLGFSVDQLGDEGLRIRVSGDALVIRLDFERPLPGGGWDIRLNEDTLPQLVVNRAMGQVDQVTQQNAAMVEQSTAASQTLRRDATRLSDLVANFRLSAGAAQKAQRAPTPQPERSIRTPRHAAQGNAALAVEQLENDWRDF